MDFLSATPLLIYRAKALPAFDFPQREALRLGLTQFMYEKQKEAGEETADVVATVQAGEFATAALAVSYIHLKCVKRHLVCFIEHEGHVLVLVRLAYEAFMVELFASLDADPPLVLSKVSPTSAQIQSFYNKLGPLVEKKPSLLGHMDLTFLPGQDDMLRNIMVHIPLEDCSQIVERKPVGDVYKWLTQHTTIEFAHLALVGVNSRLAQLTASGRFRMVGNDRTTADIVAVLFQACAESL